MTTASRLRSAQSTQFNLSSWQENACELDRSQKHTDNRNTTMVTSVMRDRQIGRTTNQMLNAPKGAVFIWPTAFLCYPRQLARAIGRDDLLIKPISWLDPSRLHGIRAVAIVDHSCCELTRENLEALDFLRMRMLSISEETGA